MVVCRRRDSDRSIARRVRVGVAFDIPMQPVPLEFRIDQGKAGLRHVRTCSVAPGVTTLDLAFAPDTVPAGDHTAGVRSGTMSSSTPFAMQAVNRQIDARLAAVGKNADLLQGLIADGRQQGLDMALPDVTLCVIELFRDWILLDRERAGQEALAISEAKHLERLAGDAVVEARAILATPDLHPRVEPPDVLRARLVNGNWQVDGRPVFLIGLNQMSTDHLEALNRAWSKAYTSFDQVRAPDRPDDPAPYTDFCRWNDDRVSRFCAAMCEAVHTGDPQALTTIKFGNESMVCGSANQAHRRVTRSRHGEGKDRYRLARLLDINGCDTRPTRASQRYAFDWEYQGMCYDIMRSYAPDKPIFDSEWHGIQTVYYHEPDQPPRYLNAALWWSYLHGVDMNITWWWGRQPDGQPRGQWFDDGLLTQPQLLDAFGKNSILVQRCAREVVAFQEDSPRLRLLFSKSSAVHDLHYLDTQKRVYETLNWLGIPIGWVSETMLLTEPPAMDMLIVTEAKHTAPGLRQVLASLATSGVSIIFVGRDCLSLDAYGRPLSDPVPIRAEDADVEDDVGVWAKRLAKAGIRRDVICTGALGQGSKPVEFRTVKMGALRLIYYVGLGRQPADVAFEIDGRRPTFTSVIDGRDYAGELTVKPYDFDLVICE